MVEQEYFRGFNFTPPVHFEVRMPETIPSESPTFTNDEREVVIIDRLPIVDFGDHEEVEVEEEVFGWSPSDVLTDLGFALQEIQQDLGIELPMNNIDILFVTKEEIIPDDEEEKKALVERYEPDILDRMAGRCIRHDNGRFTLMVAYKGQERNVSKERALTVLAHEVGHALGEFIEDPAFEEMKAYAFAGLVMRHYYETDYIELYSHPLSPERVHDVAIHRINQLTNRGLREEEIIAQLTGQPFGPYRPGDYEKAIAA